MTRASLFYQRQKQAALARAGDARDLQVKLVGVTKEREAKAASKGVPPCAMMSSKPCVSQSV